MRSVLRGAPCLGDLEVIPGVQVVGVDPFFVPDAYPRTRWAQAQSHPRKKFDVDILVVTSIFADRYSD